MVTIRTTFGEIILELVSRMVAQEKTIAELKRRADGVAMAQREEEPSESRA